MISTPSTPSSTGNLELAPLDLTSKMAPEHLNIAREAAILSASLTHRLLAYARGQPLTQVAVDPGKLYPPRDFSGGPAIQTAAEPPEKASLIGRRVLVVENADEERAVVAALTRTLDA